jgi:hypothetical protein
VRDVNIPRHLGIPHPESYAIQALAIKKHWDEIQTHCDHSTGSISRIYVRPVGGGRIFEMNYKGSDRFQLEEDESRWLTGARFVVHADISACFPSIYTHSVPWAMHSRNAAKKKRGLLDLAGNLLDKCTQNTRDRQTNGLLIGPHASNIISEIILTSVDRELISKGYRKLKRHIDDYEYYANTYEEAEKFLHQLGVALRGYELTLNEKKTKILPLPRPIEEYWVRELQRFAFPSRQELSFGIVRAFLDFALELCTKSGTTAPLYYAIKKISSKRLNQRAKRLYVQEIINLALSFPYLAPYLDKYVFEHHMHRGIKSSIREFSNCLVHLGVEKLYPDAIAHGLYLALKYRCQLKLRKKQFDQIVVLDDCIVTVLLYEYARKHDNLKYMRLIKDRSKQLKDKDAEQRELDRQWLLIYQTWTVTELRTNGQNFLADLKESGFSFVRIPSPVKTSRSARTTKAADSADLYVEAVGL